MASCATGFAPVSIDHAAFPIFRSKLGTPVSAIERHVTDHSVLERKLHWAVRLKMRAARRLFPVLTETVRPIHHPEVRGAGAAKMALQASAVLGYRHCMSCAGGRFSPAIEDRLFPALLKVPVIQSMLCRPTARRRDDEIGLGEQFGGYLQESALTPYGQSLPIIRVGWAVASHEPKIMMQQQTADGEGSWLFERRILRLTVVGLRSMLSRSRTTEFIWATGQSRTA